MTDDSAGWTGGRDAIGDIAPDLAHYTDAVLFDTEWARPALGRRDRSLVTVAALVGLGATDQLRFHLDFARRNGLTEDELVAEITHLAFYVGWPRAMAAITVARDVFAEN